MIKDNFFDASESSYHVFCWMSNSSICCFWSMLISGKGPTFYQVTSMVSNIIPILILLVMVSIFLYFVNLTFPTYLSTNVNTGLQHWKADNLDRKIQQLSYYWYRIYQYHMALDCDVTWWKPFGPYLSGWFLTVCIAHYVFWWPLNLIYFMETYQTFLGPLQI